MGNIKNQQMAFITVEDLFGPMEVVVFPKTFEKYRDCIDEDRVVLMKGKLDLKEEGRAKLLADSIEPLDEYDDVKLSSAAPEVPMVKIVIPEEYGDEDGLMKFKSIAKKHLGDTPVAILIMKSGNKYKPGYDLWIDPSDEFMNDIKSAFGDNCFR